MKSQTLIAIEGLDGSGKSTQLEALARALAAAGHRVVTTREPTDGPFGRRIREAAASGEPLDRDEELRLFQEDRREHVEQVIRPALADGAIVVTDRYYLSTVAYQGARGHDPARLLARSEAEHPTPDLVLLLEVDPKLGLERVRGRGARPEPAFEEHAFLERVAAIFRGLDRPYIERIDASRGGEEVRASVLEAVRRRLGLP